jgi:hypothetical protein
MQKPFHLIEFYGTECSHCRTMEPLVERLQDEEGLEIARLEVWHNEENARRMRELEQGRCGGVPFFYNTQTSQWICGSASYEKLKAWAVGK